MEQAPLSKVIALFDVLYNWKTIFLINMLTLSCHNMEIKTAIGNRGFLMYKKYRCLYKHISNYIWNILKSFAAFGRVVSLQLNL